MVLQLLHTAGTGVAEFIASLVGPCALTQLPGTAVGTLVQP
jgi:hypothetical protein